MCERWYAVWLFPDGWTVNVFGFLRRTSLKLVQVTGISDRWCFWIWFNCQLPTIMFCGLSVFNIRVLCVRRHRFLINVDSLSLVLVLLWAVGYVPANVQTRQSLGPLIIYVFFTCINFYLDLKSRISLICIVYWLQTLIQFYFSRTYWRWN